MLTWTSPGRSPKRETEIMTLTKSTSINKDTNEVKKMISLHNENALSIIFFIVLLFH